VWEGKVGRKGGRGKQGEKREGNRKKRGKEIKKKNGRKVGNTQHNRKIVEIIEGKR